MTWVTSITPLILSCEKPHGVSRHIHTRLSCNPTCICSPQAQTDCTSQGCSDPYCDGSQVCKDGTGCDQTACVYGHCDDGTQECNSGSGCADCLEPADCETNYTCNGSNQCAQENNCADAIEAMYTTHGVSGDTWSWESNNEGWAMEGDWGRKSTGYSGSMSLGITDSTSGYPEAYQSPSNLSACASCTVKANFYRKAAMTGNGKARFRCSPDGTIDNYYTIEEYTSSFSSSWQGTTLDIPSGCLTDQFMLFFSSHPLSGSVDLNVDALRVYVSSCP